MSGQWVIAAEGWLSPLPPCHGREKSPLPQFWWFLCPWKCHREERWERAAGKQNFCPAGNRKCRVILAIRRSASGHHFCSLLLPPTDFTTSLHRLIGQMLKLCDLIMQNIMFWNEQFILESADWKILWFHHSSKHKPVIYCVYGIPFYEKAFL